MWCPRLCLRGQEQCVCVCVLFSPSMFYYQLLKHKIFQILPTLIHEYMTLNFFFFLPIFFKRPWNESSKVTAHVSSHVITSGSYSLPFKVNKHKVTACHVTQEPQSVGITLKTFLSVGFFNKPGAWLHLYEVTKRGGGLGGGLACLSPRICIN